MNVEVPREGVRTGSGAPSPTLVALAEPGLDRVVRLAAAALAVPTALFSVIEDGRQRIKSAVIHGRPAALREIPVEHSLCAGVARAGAAVRYPDVREVPECDGNPLIEALQIVAYLAVPVLVDGAVVGVLSAIAPQRRPWSPEDVAILVDLAVIAADEIELGRFRQEARAGTIAPRPPTLAPERSTATPRTDLPELLDRRAFRTSAIARLLEARRTGRGMLLYLVRVDGAGGRASTGGARDQVHTVLARSAGPGDLLGQIATDAYVVLAPDTGHAETARALGRLQLGMVELGADPDGPGVIAFRCGVASWDPARPADLDQLLLRADGSARARASAG